MKKLLKTVSLALILIIISTSLFSCSPRPLAQSKLAKQVIGTVGSHDVYYEELYFLANGYKDTAIANHGDDSEAVNKAILDYVSENIIENYAVLDFCAAEGLDYKEKELRSDVNKEIELIMNSYFNGDKKAYFESQLNEGMTDHYFRFCTGIDILYGKLATKYQTDGKIPNTDSDIKNYIKENFVHTIHVAVYVDKNDDREKEYAKILEAKKLLDSGNSIYKVIGSKYNENLVTESLSNADGYYFPRGIMEKDYEDAAFSLKNVGDRTDIITSVGKSPSGAYVECFYIIEKLEVKNSEIEANFTYLSDMVKDSIIAKEKENYRKNLSFTPNDYMWSLDLSNLEAPKNGADYTMIIAIVASVLSVASIIVAIFVFRTVRAKKFHKKHKR